MSNEHLSGDPNQENEGSSGNKIKIRDTNGQIVYVPRNQLQRAPEPTAESTISEQPPAHATLLPPKPALPEPTKPLFSGDETTSEQQLVAPKPAKDKEEYDTEVDPEELRELATQIIAFNVDRYDELNALGGISLDELRKMTPEERQKKEIEMQEQFNAPARNFFEELVVHHTGEYYYGVDAANNKPIVFNTTDIDGRGAVGLFRAAGVYIRDLSYVKPSQFIKGKVNLDTSDHWGLVVGLPGEGEKGLSPEEVAKRKLRKTIIIDHHGPNAPKNMCATKFTYQVLDKLGMFDRYKEDDGGRNYLKAIEKTVDIINEHDNGRYPFDLYEESDTILSGLLDRMFFESNYEYKTEPPTQIPGVIDVVYHHCIAHGEEDTAKLASVKFDSRQLEILGLQRAQKDKREEINSSIEALHEAEKNGLIVNSSKYGRIVVDVGGYVKGGWWATKCSTILGQAGDVYLKWPNDRSKKKGFFISASKDFDDDIQALIDEEGLKVRGNMWLKNQAEEPLQTSLADILFAMGVSEQEILKSRNTPEGRFNPRGLFAQIQREQDRTGRRPYAQIPPQQRR